MKVTKIVQSAEKSESHALVAEKSEKKKFSSSSRSERGRNNFQNKGRKENFYCDHCHKTGHTKDRCWELYPHLKINFEKNRKDHAAMVDTSISMNQFSQLLQQFCKSMSSESNPSSASTNVSGNLQAYLTSSSRVTSWIIDSGATDHMTNNISSIHDFIPKVANHEVSVANGSTAPVIGSGKINLFPHYSNSKFEALVVPSFPI